MPIASFTSRGWKYKTNLFFKPQDLLTSSDNIPFAVAVIVLTVLALSLGDALIKFTSSEFVIWQIFILRSLIAIPCLILYIVIKERQVLTLPRALLWTSVRSLLLVSMWICYYVSLPHLSLSVAAACYYTLPIFITLGSAALTGDRVTSVGWLAVALGFLGVLLILKPSASNFNWYALLPILSAILYAAAMILTRTKCRSEHPLLLSLALNTGFVVVGSAVTIFIATTPTESRQGFLLAPWSQMNLNQWLAMALLSVAILIGSIGAAIAYQRAPSSVIGVFDFAYVGFAVLWGALFFSDYPDIISFTGIGLIVIAGVISVLRQRS